MLPNTEGPAAHADAALACAGAEPPGRLGLMPELATRLGWGLVLQLRRLSSRERWVSRSTRGKLGGVAVAACVPVARVVAGAAASGLPDTTETSRVTTWQVLPSVSFLMFV